MAEQQHIRLSFRPGDCTYYIRLIDDCGYTDAMKVSGSNTLFFSNDASFERFFQTNEMGYRSYEDLPYSFKMMLLKLGTIPYSQLLERLSLSDRGQVTFRRTTDFEVEDTIPVVDAEDLPDSKYFAPLPPGGQTDKIVVRCHEMDIGTVLSRCNVREAHYG